MLLCVMSLEQHEEFSCPYCGEINTLPIDFTGGAQQEFVVDCEVCCAPIIIYIKMRGREVINIAVSAENE